MKMNEINILDRKIGINHKPLVIAEIGINHNGSLSEAFKIVDAAASTGVEVIKHQTHIISDEMSGHAKTVIPGNSDKSIYEIMEDCSLSEDEEIALKEYIEKKGMIFISTPFSRAAVDRLIKMDVPAFKIGSGECNNFPLLEYISSFKKPIILSTGMNTMNEVGTAIGIFKKADVDFAILHTTNLYPTPPNLVRLGAMQEIAEKFPGIIYGLSDHTVTNHACFGAVALGASILEKHFTDDMSREGPDIVCSMDPLALKDLIFGANLLFEERGGTKGPAKEEQVTMDFAFSTIVTIKPIRKGEPFTEKNIWVKRPGLKGLKAHKYKEVLGKIARSDFPEDHHIEKDDVVW